MVFFGRTRLLQRENKFANLIRRSAILLAAAIGFAFRAEARPKRSSVPSTGFSRLPPAAQL